MPRYARRSYRRRRYARSRRVRRYATTRRRRARRGSVNVHTFRRWEPLGTRPFALTTDANGNVFAGNAFRLDLTTNYGELTTLFDSYRILCVWVRMTWSPDSASGTTFPPAYPEFWYKRDYDDASTPISSAEFEQSNQTRVWRPTNMSLTKTIKLRPAAQNTMYRTGVTSAYASIWRPWLDCNTADVPHYGLKLMCRGMPSTEYGQLNLRVCYLVQLKNVR